MRAGVRGARQLHGLVGSYLYAVPYILGAPVDVRVTRIHRPKAMRVEWNDGGGGPGGGIPYVVQRLNPSTQAVLAQITTADELWVDSFDFHYGTTCAYPVWAQAASNGNEQLPSPPEGANPQDIAYYCLPSEPTSIEAPPQFSVAADNQTVDRKRHSRGKREGRRRHRGSATGCKGFGRHGRPYARHPCLATWVELSERASSPLRMQ